MINTLSINEPETPDLCRIPLRRPRTSYLRRKQMGRPLRKDVNGVDVINTGAGAATGVRVDFYDGSTLQTDGVIIKQRGANTFVVCRVGDIGTTANYKVCKLVDTAPNAAGEMRIMGYVGGNGVDNLVPIRKITKRLAYGFPTVPVLSSGYYRGEDSAAATNHNGALYKWYLENDSSADYIVLQAV